MKNRIWDLILLIWLAPVFIWVLFQVTQGNRSFFSPIVDLFLVYPIFTVVWIGGSILLYTKTGFARKDEEEKREEDYSSYLEEIPVIEKFIKNPEWFKNIKMNKDFSKHLERYIREH